VTAGAEKLVSRLRPEKPWFDAEGRGFDSRHLHHPGLTRTPLVEGGVEEVREWSAIDGALLDGEGAVVAFEGSVEMGVAAGVDECVERVGEGLSGDLWALVVVVEVEAGEDGPVEYLAGARRGVLVELVGVFEQIEGGEEPLACRCRGRRWCRGVAAGDGVCRRGCCAVGP
jgi:hypothetical protein